MASSGAPSEFGVVEEVPAVVAELTDVPPFMDVPASTGIEGSSILISVLTEGFGFA